MDSLARVRRASIQAAKIQRRVWLVQTIFWPAIAVGCIVTMISLGGWLRRRRNAAAATNDLAVATDDRPAGEANGRAIEQHP